MVELGLKRGKVPRVPITPTPDPGITCRLIQGARKRRVYKSRPVDCTVSIPFVATEIERVSSGWLKNRAINDYSLSRGHHHPLLHVAPPRLLISARYSVSMLPVSRSATGASKVSRVERNQEDEDGWSRERVAGRERGVSLWRQKARLITGRPQVPVKRWQRQLSVPKAVRGTKVYARRELFAPEKTRSAFLSVRARHRPEFPVADPIQINVALVPRSICYRSLRRPFRR